jgi:SSS family solute:Na+ symporter
MISFMESHEMAPLTGKAVVSLIAMILMTSFGTWGLPQMVHKYYGIRDKREVKRGIIISTFFAFLVAGGGYFIGSFSHLFFAETMPEGGKDYIVPLMLDMAGLPNILIGVILVLLISASVSTLSGITLTACSTISMDLVRSTIKKNIDDKSTAMLTRILCLVFVVLSYIIATSDTPIIELMSYSWGIISGSFLAPYVLLLYSKKINKAGAWAGMLGGFLIAFVPAAASGFTTPDGPIYACAAMAGSFVLCLFVSKLATVFKFKSAERNDEFYTGSL